MSAPSHHETHHRACHLCEAICGLEIEVQDGRVIAVRGDKSDPLSRGHICPKAVALKDIHEDPDRLRHPVKRLIDANGNHQWVTISWDEALDTTAAKLVDITQRESVHALGIYLGNPSVHNYGMLTHQSALFQYFRTNNRFSATSVDQLPHHLASMWLFGHKLLFPIPDIDRSNYFLMLGANPLASNGSIWTVPDVRKRIKAFAARGGKLVVLDPRRTETADLATEHHFMTPGSDAVFLLAVLNTLFEERLCRLGRLASFTQGLEDVSSAISDFDADYAAPHTGIKADVIRDIAREFAAADSAICYGRMGVSTQAFGALNQWLIQLINIVTGNLDKPGGSMFPLPAVDQISATGPGGFGRHHSRVRQLPEFDRELPSATLAEEILTPGEGQIRALFTGAGNPVLSSPNGRQLDKALEQLEFMVSLDPYINETTRHADIILPPTSPLEHDHYDLAFHNNAIRNTARFNEAVFAKPQDSMHDWEIFAALGERVANRLGLQAQPRVPPAEIIDLGLQVGPYSDQGLSLEELRNHPSGIDLGPLQSQLPSRLRTPGQVIHCATPEPLGDLQRVRETFASSSSRKPNELLLIGRRHVRSNNSWMHNFHRLMKGKPRCTLLMHPDDMQRLQLQDARHVTLRSRVGTLRVLLEASEDIMPGTVSLPHGFGHDREGIRMHIARGHAGVSCNDITDELAIDALSGNAAVNGITVTVTTG
ncbi:MAG: molybdopterin-dependent oxidoreductase [Pseudomonadota bacterium]